RNASCEAGIGNGNSRPSGRMGLAMPPKPESNHLRDSTSRRITGGSPLLAELPSRFNWSAPMPYSRISDLPAAVRDNVPKHGQEIYKEAYNSAWDQYKDPDDRRGDASREEVAHRVAWSAVKEKYEKGDD